MKQDYFLKIFREQRLRCLFNPTFDLIRMKSMRSFITIKKDN